MTVKVHIERLVLEGLPLAPGDSAAVGASLEADLTSLIAAGGLAGQIRNGAAVPRLRGTDLQVAPGSSSRLGKHIAGSVYGALGGAK